MQKHFGVTEEDARRVKIDYGLTPPPGNEEYLSAIISTISAIRDEVVQRFAYWQKTAAVGSLHEPITHVLVVGGNASIRGLSEYFESELKVPVATGDVFTNFAPRATWLPPLSYAESLAYATAIGLALRSYDV